MSDDDDKAINLCATEGRYDAMCESIQGVTEARSVAVLVVKGRHGNGFSVRAPMRDMPLLADMFEAAAQQIRQQLALLDSGPGPVQ